MNQPTEGPTLRINATHLSSHSYNSLPGRQPTHPPTHLENPFSLHQSTLKTHSLYTHPTNNATRSPGEPSGCFPTAKPSRTPCRQRHPTHQQRHPPTRSPYRNRQPYILITPPNLKTQSLCHSPPESPTLSTDNATQNENPTTLPPTLLNNAHPPTWKTLWALSHRRALAQALSKRL